MKLDQYIGFADGRKYPTDATLLVIVISLLIRFYFSLVFFFTVARITVLNVFEIEDEEKYN